MIYEIVTEEDYQRALKRFLEICCVPKDSSEAEELYLLIALMEKYERDNCSAN